MPYVIAPDFLTVIEAARILRIGRTVAYEQASRYEATGGAEGLPVMRIGRQMRVPRALLEQLAGVPLTDVIGVAPEVVAAERVVEATPQRRLRSVPERGDQAALPFGS